MEMTPSLCPWSSQVTALETPAFGERTKIRLIASQLHAEKRLTGVADCTTVAELVVVLTTEVLVLTGGTDRVCRCSAAVFHSFT